MLQPLKFRPTISLRKVWTPLIVRCSPTRNHYTAGDTGGRNQWQTVDAEDVKRHANLAQDWWNPNGPMRALHSLNSIRLAIQFILSQYHPNIPRSHPHSVPFIRDGLISTIPIDPQLQHSARPLHQLHLLEVGCGAGILTESLARLHANVTAIDPGQAVIDAALAHLAATSNSNSSGSNSSLASRIDYRCETIEEHAAQSSDATPTRIGLYDACIVSEVLEHVVDKPAFLRACLSTVRPGGSIFITTFNRTCASWLGGIVVAEYLTRLVPRGTHDWDRFCTPVEVQRWLAEMQCSTVLLNGFVYDMLTDRWRWIPTLDLSYALHAVKGH